MFPARAQAGSLVYGSVLDNDQAGHRTTGMGIPGARKYRRRDRCTLNSRLTRFDSKGPIPETLWTCTTGREIVGKA